MPIRPMQRDDLAQVVALWRRCTGVVLSSADRPEELGRYLDRNPGLSLVAADAGRVVAALLCGHDGRRGYLHHLAVDPACRGRGIGRRLVSEATELLRRAGIRKCHIFILRDNPAGLAFWKQIGWTAREDIGVVSVDLEPAPPRSARPFPDGKDE